MRPSRTVSCWPALRLQPDAQAGVRHPVAADGRERRLLQLGLADGEVEAHLLAARQLDRGARAEHDLAVARERSGRRDRVLLAAAARAQLGVRRARRPADRGHPVLHLDAEPLAASVGDERRLTRPGRERHGCGRRNRVHEDRVDVLSGLVVEVGRHQQVVADHGDVQRVGAAELARTPSSCTTPPTPFASPSSSL